jgi:hypothetical protein
MTRFFPRRFHRALLTVAALLGAGVLGLSLTGAASASPLHGEFFNLSFPAATGTAYGPVHGVFTDNEISPTSGIWTFTAPAGRVQVDHTAVGQPTINPRTCSGFLFENGQWQMYGLTGADRHAFGFGRFQLVEFVQLGRDHQRWQRDRCDPRDVITENVYVAGQGLAANH